MDTNSKDAHIAVLEEHVRRLKRELQLKEDAIRRKNLDLDALHFVWCSGGCDGGYGRYSKAELTEGVVVMAERNTRRLREYYEARQCRLHRGKTEKCKSCQSYESCKNNKGS